MMSKNSFWANMVENGKRRTWLTVVSGLLWFFYYPVGVAIVMSRAKMSVSFGAFVSEEEVKTFLIQRASEWLGTNEVTAVLVSAVAILCAIQGFSYLYSRRKVDFYHSVPIPKSRRFTVVYVNSILIFFVPYMINLLLGVVVAGVNGGIGNTFPIGEVFFGIFLNILLFLATYALTAIAVMLTGNVIITLFGTAIFLFYEAVVMFIYTSLQEYFFSYFSYNSVDYKMHLSPMGKYIHAVRTIKSAGTENAGVRIAEVGLPVVQLAALVFLFTGLAYFCYWKRPSEAAGKAMAFPKTKGIIKLLITVPCSLLAGLALIDIVGTGNSGIYNMPMVVFGIAAAVVLSNCIIEVIYEQDIRAALKKIYQILISGGCVAVVFCSFYFDLTGFDKWAPDEEKLDNAVVIVNNIANRQNYWKDEGFYYIDETAHYLEGEGIKDLQAILELSGKKGMVEEEDMPISCEVGYRMKNGKTIWRSFSIGASEENTLNKIIGNKEFKETSYPIYSDSLFERFKQLSDKKVAYNSGIGIENLSTEDLDIIREHLIKDMEHMDYSTLRNEYACGKLDFTAKFDRNSWIEVYQYDIYPSFTNTIGYLKEKGVYMECVPALEDIESITVVNDHNEESYYLRGYNSNYSSYSNENIVTKNFTDENQIKELTEALYPSSFEQNFRRSISDQYRVTIRLKTSALNSAYNRGSTEYKMIAEKIPDWLEKETAYE